MKQNALRATPVTALALAAVALLSSCVSFSIPSYSPSMDTRSSLRDGGLQPLAVGRVTSDETAKDSPESVSARAGTLEPPLGTYADYLRGALVLELKGARLYDPDSPLQIEAVLLANRASAGMSSGDAEVSASFVVKRDGDTIYDKVHSHTEVFKSGFDGGTAIAAAMIGVEAAFTGLLTKLFQDPEFIQAVKEVDA